MDEDVVKRIEQYLAKKEISQQNDMKKIIEMISNYQYLEALGILESIKLVVFETIKKRGVLK
jgi:hypothetical protein